MVNNTSARFLDSGEPIPQNLSSAPWIEVRDPAAATAKVNLAIESWVSELETVDAGYPHSPKMAAYIYRWCDMHIDSAQNADERKRWISRAQAWAEEGVRRSPREFALRGMLGKVLFQRAGVEPSAAVAVDTLQRGVSEFREATVLYPISEEAWGNYGEALKKAGAAFKRAGDAGRGDAMIADGEKAKAWAKEIKEYKERTHTGATG